MSKKLNLEAMSLDEMWQLHQDIGQILSVRLTSEKRELEKRLSQLRRERATRQPEPHDEQIQNGVARERRKYPRVYPKYKNPHEPSETWSGRGKQPRWLVAALKGGHSIDEFEIDTAELNKSSLSQQPT